MPYEPKAVANYFLDLANGCDPDMSPMKIQKLVFFAHGWHLALTGYPLISESIQAWDYGPVIRSLYDAFRAYGNRQIGGRACELDHRFDSDSGELLSVQRVPSIDDPIDDPSGDRIKSLVLTKAILNRVYSIYGKFDGMQLSDMTHEEWSPWRVVQKAHPSRLPRGLKIPDDTIRRCFLGLLAAEKPAPQTPI